MSFAVAAMGCGWSSGLDRPPPAPPLMDMGSPRPDLGRPDRGLPDEGASDLGPPDLGRLDFGPDAGPPECTRDEDCADLVFCNGDERCRSGFCERAAPRCVDGVDCTEDLCDEEQRECAFVPRPDLCPLSNRCDPVDGCQERVLTSNFQQLFDVLIPGFGLLSGPTLESTITDVALSPDGEFFAIGTLGLFTLDVVTGDLEALGEGEGGNSLAFDDEGRLWSAGGLEARIVDTFTGETLERFRLPGSASGDIAFIQGRPLVTVIDPMGRSDQLAEIDEDAGTTSFVGPTGFGGVWGLAAFGTTLYGFTSAGQVLEIDADTGEGTLLRTHAGQNFLGAAAL